MQEVIEVEGAAKSDLPPYFFTSVFWMTKGGWVGFGSQVCGYYVPICFSHLGKIQNHFATGLRPRIPPTYPEASYLQ